MKILQEGPPLECFYPTNGTKLWADHVVQRPAQCKHHHNYKKKTKSNNNNNCESSSTDDHEFEM